MSLIPATNEQLANVYWAQNITNTSQALLVLFQEKDRASMFSIGKYTSYGHVSNDWVETKYTFTVQEGSPLSMIFFTGPQDLLIYAVGGEKRLARFGYNVSSDTVLEYGCKYEKPRQCILKVTANSFEHTIVSKSALTVALQNNTSPYSWGQRPECSRLLPYTHLVLATSSDGSSLSLNSWNCSSGFGIQTAQIAPLLQGKKRFFALASHQDGRGFVSMLDVVQRSKSGLYQERMGSNG